MYNAQQQALLTMQKIDLDGATIRRAYTEHAGHKRVKEIEAALEKIEIIRETLDEKIHELQQQITAGHDEIEKAQEKIQSEQLELTRVSDPRTVQVLHKDIDSLKRRIDKTEFDEVGLLEQLDVQNAKRAELAKKAEQLSVVQEKTAKGLVSLKEQVEAKVASYAQRRAEAKAQIPSEWLEEYGRLMADKKNVAVAEFVNDTCTVCRVKLATTQIEEIRENAGGFCICPSCKRLIVVP